MTDQIVTIRDSALAGAESVLNSGRIDMAIYTDPRLKSEHSRRQYRSNLEDFERWRMGQPLTKMLVEAYAAHLQRRNLAATTINQKLASIRWWARKIVDFAFEQLPPEQAERVSKQAARVLTVEDVRGESAPAGRFMKPHEIKKLLRACMEDGTPAGLRDKALFSVAWMTGPRRDELCELRMEDLTVIPADDENSNDEGELLLHGKGDKPRLAYLYGRALAALLEWLAVRGDAPGYIFCQVRKNGTVLPGRALSGEALRKVGLKRFKQANMKHTTWHDFRRRFASELWDAGVDGVIIKDLMGHASMETTAAYDRRPEHARRAAVKKLTIPEVTLKDKTE